MDKVKVKVIKFSPEVFIANIINIQQSLDDIGIRRNAENSSYLAAVLIAEMIKQNLTKEQVLWNFSSVYDLLIDNFDIGS